MPGDGIPSGPSQVEMLTPHVVVRRLAEEALVNATKVVAGKGYGEGTTFLAYCYPLSASAAAQQTGILDLNRPHGLMWPVDDPDRFPYGTLVEWDNRHFVVSTPTQTHKFGNASDNCTAVMEELQYVPLHGGTPVTGGEAEVGEGGFAALDGASSVSQSVPE